MFAARARRTTGVLIALTFAFALAAPALARAASFTNEYPFGAVNAPPQLLGVTAFSSVAFDTRSAKMTLDGATVKAYLRAGSASGYWSATEVYNPVVGAWTIKWTWVPGGSDPTKSTIYAYPVYTTPLADGTHTVAASIKDVTGATWTDSWTFSYLTEPTFGTPSPADGSTVDTTTPAISVPVSDNSPGALTVSATVNGSPAAATVVAGVASITSPVLANDATATVSVTVTDASGASASMTWSFGVQVYAAMAFPVGECSSCHPDAAADPDMADDCALCHAGQLDRPHQSDPTDYHTRADVSECSPCHVSEVTVEHARRSLTCMTCHTSTDPLVVAAIASHQTACSVCHASADHASAHQESVETCFGTCHDTQLLVTHEAVATPPSCAECHLLRDAAARPWDRKCAACHATITHTTASASHVGTDTAVRGASVGEERGCAETLPGQRGCHVITNIAELHLEAPGGCNVCHGEGKTPSAECLTCHPTSGSGGGNYPETLASVSWYHHNNVKYLIDSFDATPNPYYNGSGSPDSGWYDSAYYNDCADLCHHNYVDPGAFSANTGQRMWFSAPGGGGWYGPQIRTLTSAPATLPAGAYLDFTTYYALNHSWGDGAARVQASTDGGDSWTTLTGTIGGTSMSVITSDSAGWVPAHYDLAAYSGQSTQIRFSFDDQLGWCTGWALDDIAIGGNDGLVFTDGAETKRPEWTSSYWIRSMSAYPAF